MCVILLLACMFVCPPARLPASCLPSPPCPACLLACLPAVKSTAWWCSGPSTSSYPLSLKPHMPSSRSLPGEDEVARLHRLLGHLGEAGASSSDSGAGERGSQADTAGEPPLPPPTQAAALLQRLASLVQAGLPMAKRGAFWRLFLNVASKRKEGEYARLVADVEALEQRLGADRDSSTSSGNHGSSGGAGCGTATPVLPGAAKLAAAADYDAGQYGNGQERYGSGGHTPAGVFNLVADASSRAGGASQQDTSPPRRQLQQHHRVSTFRIAPLEDDSPGATEDESAAHFGSERGYEEMTAETPGNAVAAAAGTPPPPCGLAQPTPAALMTPASTLQTPLTSSSRGTDGGASSSGPPSTGASLTGAAERWRQQEWLAQIDKDLVSLLWVVG